MTNTNQQVQDDVQALQDLKKQLQDEHDEVEGVLNQTADEVERQPSADLAEFDKAAGELASLEAQADAEEKAGQ